MSGSPRVDISEAASVLLAAEAAKRTCDQLTKRWPEMNVADAYAIQAEALKMRLKRGEKLVGIKLGLTSKAKQIQMKVGSPTTAWLTDAMSIAEGTMPSGAAAHPRAEPEIVVTTSKRLKGPGVTAADVMEALGEVRCGIEILDSRYENFKFTLPDVVADNASSGRFVFGKTALPASRLDLAAEECVLSINGKQVATATGAAVMGHPAEAIAWAANFLAERDEAIEAGWVIMTGGMTDAYPVESGAEVTAKFTHLGSVTIKRGT
ncbi:MAG TPA: fumarylacetoacetate hydrolase family protein [Candidatus Binataceae bacterium]|nr:fumarylacetoacetate hydrolase family protein [Candidatus Binataceae bacterium]